MATAAVSTGCSRRTPNWAPSKVPSLTPHHTLEQSPQLHCSSTTGLDICPSDRNDKRVLIGDAHNMQQVADASIDIVLNLEASHAYYPEDRFIGEVMRILYPWWHQC